MSEPLRRFLHDLDHRCDNLIADFRRDRTGEIPEIQAYVATLWGLVERASERVRTLLADPDYTDESIAQHLFYNYKRLAEFVQSMEVGPAFVLERFNDSDRAASRLIARICEDIGFPHSAPLCSATSAEYYWTRVDVGLVYMPFTETRHVLTWPDLYHELAHILVARDSDNILVPSEDLTIRYFHPLIEAIAETVIDYCKRSPLKGFLEGDSRNGPTQHIHDAWIAFREAPDEFAAKERTLSQELLAPSSR